MSLRGFLLMREERREELPLRSINYRSICGYIIHYLFTGLLIFLCWVGIIIYDRYPYLGIICISISPGLLLYYLVTVDNMSRRFILRSRIRLLNLVLGNNICSVEDPVNSDCSICLELIDIEQRYTKLQCNHVYHRDCIQNWLIIRTNCPLCRIDISN